MDLQRNSELLKAPLRKHVAKLRADVQRNSVLFAAELRAIYNGTPAKVTHKKLFKTRWVNRLAERVSLVGSRRETGRPLTTQLRVADTLAGAILPGKH